MKLKEANGLMWLWRRIAALCLCTFLAAAPALAASTKPAGGNKKEKEKDSAGEFFANPIVQTFQIEISEASLKSLAGSPRTDVSGTLRVGTHVFTNVAIHLKGNGSFRSVDEKPSFAVKFDAYASGQEFFGLTKLMFNNSVQDPTYLAELLATGLFRDAGLPAARVTHARVKLNGRDLGLFVAIEGMNKRFLKQHFKSPKGNLYEGYLQDIDSKLDQDNGDNTSQADVRELREACSIPDGGRRWSVVSQKLDVDKFISFVAMEILTSHWDGYANHTNNFRLYHDPGADKMVFITHGLDWAFRRPNIALQPPLKSIVGRAVLATDPGRKLFEERIGVLYTNVFRISIITNRLEQAMRRLRTAGLDAATLAKIERNAAILRERVELRSLRVAEQLAGIPPAPPQFDTEGTARLSGWRDESDRGEPVMDQPRKDGRETMHVRAAGGRSRASWRTQVYLPRGRYRVEGMASSEGITGGSAGLRISGGRRDTGVGGTSPWRLLFHDFEVVDDGLDVEIVCDFYGTTGEAWFDVNSFRLKRL
ncbi:MAG TPA: CotH kinase family protein [Candidatus Eisenbacteria bacterium]|nr:CotH kinase family protein [Candidatus Eisenbacteria bacterium]